jgi:hypothetical protein
LGGVRVGVAKVNWVGFRVEVEFEFGVQGSEELRLEDWVGLREVRSSAVIAQAEGMM